LLLAAEFFYQKILQNISAQVDSGTFLNSKEILLFFYLRNKLINFYLYLSSFQMAPLENIVNLNGAALKAAI
jgi:hypothetical protein